MVELSKLKTQNDFEYKGINTDFVNKNRSGDDPFSSYN